MGGKALKSTYTRRYERLEYDLLCKELIPKLKESFQTEIHLVESFKNKESFGDADFLILGRFEHEYIVSILRTFKPNEIYKNSHIYSFDYKELQIDLIFTKPEEWESSKLFFNGGDLGNLIGKMYHKIGCKYGFSGLVFPVRDYEDKKLLDNIVISTNGQKIFEFIGLSWDRYLKGFNEEKDMFDYIIESRFFDPKVFLFENLNSINKKRNKRRKGYGMFVDYVKDMKSKYIFDESDKASHIIELEEYFNVPLRKMIDDLNQLDQYNKSINGKLNGKLIIEWSGINEGKEIGKILEDFRKYLKKHGNLVQYLENSSMSEIKKEFDNFYVKN